MTSRPGLRSRPFARAITLLLAVVAVLATATACEVKSGAAAFVGDTRITEDDVASYLVRGSTAQTQTGEQNARQLAVSFLVIRALAVSYLDGNGVARGTAAIQSVRADVLGDDPDSTLAQARTESEQAGLTSGFVDLRVEVVSLVQLIERSGVDNTALGQALSAGPTVRLSPRYGTWNAQTLTIDSATPAYLQLSTPAPAAA